MKDIFCDISIDKKEEHFKKVIEYRENLKLNPDLQQLFIEVTLRCNENCLHCGSNAGCKQSDKGVITNVEIIQTLKTLKTDLEKDRKALPFIVITGGEPLLRKNLIELVKEIHKLGYEWGMTSNGVLITQDMARQLKEAGMYSIGLSLDGLEGTHNWFRQTKNGYQKAIEGFENLKSVGQHNVMITTVVNKRNIHQLDEMLALLIKLKCKTWRIINIEPIGRALKNKELMLDKEEYKQMYKFIVNHQSERSINIISSCNHYIGLNYERQIRPWYFRCQAGVSVASIQCNGDISACLDIERRPEFVFGNIRNDNLYNVWLKGFKIFRGHSKTEQSTKCKNCKQRDKCDGGGWHTWNFDKNEPRICMYNIINDA